MPYKCEQKKDILCVRKGLDLNSPAAHSEHPVPGYVTPENLSLLIFKVIVLYLSLCALELLLLHKSMGFFERLPRYTIIYCMSDFICPSAQLSTSWTVTSLYSFRMILSIFKGYNQSFIWFYPPSLKEVRLRRI